MITRITRRMARRADTGGALVELAVVMPLLVVVFVGAADFARTFYLAMELTNGARAGAQYGSIGPAQSGDTSGMQTTAINAMSTATQAGATAAASRFCQCASDTGTFSATAPTANDCTSPVATSCPGGHLVVTVTVTTSKTFTTIIGFGLPGFMRSMSLSRAATLRVIQVP
jgi:Flp pilus assembly protein TadG